MSGFAMATCMRNTAGRTLSYTNHEPHVRRSVVVTHSVSLVSVAVSLSGSMSSAAVF